MTLTLAQARSILDKTLAVAREKKFKPLGVAVVDSRGALRAYAEEDGNPILRSKIACGKAFGSVAFGTGSRRLHQIGVERPHMAAALVEMTGGTLVLQGYTPKQLEYKTGGPPFAISGTVRSVKPALCDPSVDVSRPRSVITRS